MKNITGVLMFLSVALFTNVGVAQAATCPWAIPGVEYQTGTCKQKMSNGRAVCSAGYELNTDARDEVQCVLIHEEVEESEVVESEPEGEEQLTGEPVDVQEDVQDDAEELKKLQAIIDTLIAYLRSRGVQI